MTATSLQQLMRPRGQKQRPKGESAPPADSGGVLMVPIDAIRPDKNQPRRNRGDFTKESLAGLAAHMEVDGVLQPILVCSLGSGKYQIVMGERRWRAARQAGLEQVPVIVGKPLSKVAQVAENWHRQAMSTLDIMAFVAEQIGDGMSGAELARRLGTSEGTISEYYALARAPECVVKAMESGRCTDRTAALAMVKAYKHAPKAVERLAKQSTITRVEAAALAKDAKAAGGGKPQASSSGKRAGTPSSTSGVDNQQQIAIQEEAAQLSPLNRTITVMVGNKTGTLLPNHPATLPKSTQCWVHFEGEEGANPRLVSLSKITLAKIE